MSVKMKGAEFNAFYHDEEFWPKNAWHDYHDVSVNGQYRDELDEGIADDDDVIIEDGVVYIPTETEDGMQEKEVKLTTFFKNWRKKTNFAILVVTVEKEHLEAATASIKSVTGVSSVK